MTVVCVEKHCCTGWRKLEIVLGGRPTFLECRLQVFENQVLRRMFGPKKGKVTWEWRRLHNEELHALYSSPNII
jgi:hypothetical protein